MLNCMIRMKCFPALSETTKMITNQMTGECGMILRSLVSLKPTHKISVSFQTAVHSTSPPLNEDFPYDPSLPHQPPKGLHKVTK